MSIYNWGKMPVKSLLPLKWRSRGDASFFEAARQLFPLQTFASQTFAARTFLLQTFLLQTFLLQTFLLPPAASAPVVPHRAAFAKTTVVELVTIRFLPTGDATLGPNPVR